MKNSVGLVKGFFLRRLKKCLWLTGFVMEGFGLGQGSGWVFIDGSPDFMFCSTS